jgi:Tfp pilus assembly protein FimT
MQRHPLKTINMTKYQEGLSLVKTNNSQCGYSLVELCIVCGVIAIMALIAIPSMHNAIRGSDADSAAQLVSQQLAYARSLALGSHQPVIVEFDPGTQELVVARGTGSARGPFVLPGHMQIRGTAIPPATPDNLGANVIGAGGVVQIFFLDNGSAVDSPATNNLISGTVFLKHENDDASTGRAITLLGGTGRVHIWRYDTNTSNWK